MRILCLLLIIILSQELKAQSTNFDSTLHNTLPVIRHQKNSSLPEKIHVVGNLDDFPVRGMCGFFCIGGTVKVKLKERIPGYRNNYVYLVTVCISDKATKGTEINVTASKLKAKEKECYYNSIMNVFDSNGIPFYKLSEEETSKIK